MNVPFAIDPDRARALELLLSRHSCWPLVVPAPSDAELELVFAAALRACDHGRLQPWRLALVRESAQEALGEVYVKAAAPKDEEDAKRIKARAKTAPLIVAIAAHINTSCSIAEHEQLLSAGAAAMNMLNALHVMGYGAFWKSPLDGPNGVVRSALGFADNEQLIGMLHIGTAKTVKEAPTRLGPTLFVRDWPGSTASAGTSH